MGSRVVVIGSLSMDMVFQVPRRPARGETVKGFSCETFVGGKGNNQALAAAKAGAEVQAEDAGVRRDAEDRSRRHPHSLGGPRPPRTTDKFMRYVQE